MARVLTGPARCIECGAVWRAVHLLYTGEECIRCEGRLEAVEPSRPAPRLPGVDAPRFANPHATRWGWKPTNGESEAAHPEPRTGLGVYPR